MSISTTTQYQGYQANATSTAQFTASDKEPSKQVSLLKISAGVLGTVLAAGYVHIKLANELPRDSIFNWLAGRNGINSNFITLLSGLAGGSAVILALEVEELAAREISAVFSTIFGVAARTMSAVSSTIFGSNKVQQQ